MAAAWGGYVIPTRAGLLFGATHDRGQAAVDSRPGDDARNLEVLARMRPALAAALDGRTLSARAGVRASTPDRAPLAGEAAAGLFVLGGLGGRGFCLAPLLAEHIAARALGAPSPLPLHLAAHVDPKRFAPSLGTRSPDHSHTRPAACSPAPRRRRPSWQPRAPPDRLRPRRLRRRRPGARRAGERRLAAPRPGLLPGGQPAELRGGRERHPEHPGQPARLLPAQAGGRVHRPALGQHHRHRDARLGFICSGLDATIIVPSQAGGPPQRCMATVAAQDEPRRGPEPAAQAETLVWSTGRLLRIVPARQANVRASRRRVGARPSGIASEAECASSAR